MTTWNFVKQKPRPIIIRVIKILRIFKFHNLNFMRDRMIVPDSISVEKLKND